MATRKNHLLGAGEGPAGGGFQNQILAFGGLVWVVFLATRKNHLLGAGEGPAIVHGRQGRGRALGDVRPLNGPGATFPFASVACVKAGFTPFRKAAHPTHRPRGASGEDGHLELKSSQPNLRSGGPPRSADSRKWLLPVTRPAAGVWLSMAGSADGVGNGGTRYTWR